MEGKIEIKAGSEIWWIPGYSGSYLIAIKCRVETVLENGEVFLDEPSTTSISQSELMTREQAEKELRKRTLQYLKELRDTDDYEVVRRERPTLFKCRAFRLTVMELTWKELGSGERPAFPNFIEKQEGRDWFVVDVSDEEVAQFNSEEEEE